MAIDCITCGQSMPDDADFCPHCGRAVPRQVAEERPASTPTQDPSSATHDSAPIAEATAAPERQAAADKAPAAPTPETTPASPPLPPPHTVTPLPAPKPAAPSPTPKPSPAVVTRLSPPRTITPSRSIPPRAPVSPPRASGSILGAPVNTNDRLLGAVAYLTFLPAVAFLLLRQYQRRQFIRFHARQSIFFWILVVAAIGIGLLASTFGFLLVWMVTGILVALALFLTWLVLAIKALQGEWFKLPGFGNLAEHFGG